MGPALRHLGDGQVVPDHRLQLTNVLLLLPLQLKPEGGAARALLRVPPVLVLYPPEALALREHLGHQVVHVVLQHLSGTHAYVGNSLIYILTMSGPPILFVERSLGDRKDTRFGPEKQPLHRSCTKRADKFPTIQREKGRTPKREGYKK